MSLHLQIKKEVVSSERRYRRGLWVSALLTCLLFMVVFGGVLCSVRIWEALPPESPMRVYLPRDEKLITTSWNRVFPPTLTSGLPEGCRSHIVSVLSQEEYLVPLPEPLSDTAVETLCGSDSEMMYVPCSMEDVYEPSGIGFLHRLDRLMGRMYDLKHVRPGEFRKVVQKVIAADNRGLALDDCAVRVNMIFPSYLYRLPTDGRELNGDKLLHGEREMRPSPAHQPAKSGGWCMVCRSDVLAPMGGRWRFVGYGEDNMVVWLNGRVVLSCNGKGRGEVPQVEEGEVFSVQEGEVCHIEILLAGEKGDSCYALFTEYLDETEPREKAYDLFRTDFSLPEEHMQLPYNTDSAVWRCKI